MPSPLVKVSLSVIVDRDVFPVFKTVIVNTEVSPAPGKLSPLSTNIPVLVTLIPGSTVKLVLVLSSTRFPSLSFPSSLTSDTSFEFPGVLAVTETVFKIHPESTSADPIV